MAEIFLLDGRLSAISSLVLVNGFSWLLFHQVPASYNSQKNTVFLIINIVTIISVFLHIVYNYTEYDGPIILVSILFMVIFFLKDKISYKFRKEITIIQLFLFILLLFLLLPLIFSIVFNNSSSHWLYFFDLFLVKPLEKVLTLSGFTVWSTNNSIFYEDLQTSTVKSVAIANECSGIYSIFIFVSFFSSYLYVEYSRFDILVFSFILQGIIMAYIANLFRMYVIIVIGHYYGIEALVWTHANIGWLIFTFWIFIFWHFWSRYFFLKGNFE